MNSSKRNTLADLLKGIAVLLMIQVHIVELFANNALYNSAIGKFFLFLGGPPVAPVFMIILGYFLADSKKTTGELIVRGVKIFCLGMLLNIALNFNLIISVTNGLLQIDLLPYIFGVDILPFAGLAIVFIAVFKKLFDKYILTVFLLMIISPIVSQYVLELESENSALNYVSAFFYGNSHWSYFPLLPWISYPLAGFAVYKIQKRYDFSFLNLTKIKILGLVLFLLLMGFTINYAIGISSELPLYYHHNLIFFLWVILFIGLYAFIANQIEEVISNFFILKFIKWLGKNVTYIYIIQWIIIGNVATEIYKTISSPSTLLACYAGVLGLSVMITFLIEKVRKGKFKTS